MSVVGVRRAASRTRVRAFLLLGLLGIAATAVVVSWSGGAAGGFALVAGLRSPNTGAGQTGTNQSRTSGCGVAPPARPGTTSAGLLRVGSLQRSYRLRLPPSYRSTVAWPLVLSFHGHGSGAAAQETRTRLSVLADRDNFVVSYPQGVVGPDGATGWNTGRARDPQVDDVQFVATLLTQLQGELCIDPQRIYATGFSNGGGFAAILGCRLADRLAAIAPVAGDYYPQPGGCHPARPIPLLEIHGSADKINPYGGSIQLGYPSVPAWLQAWAKRDGCAPAPITTLLGAAVTREEWGNCQDGAVVVHYRLTGSPHVWPSLACEKDCVAFDAAGAIWSFFAQHPMRDTTSTRDV
jgi:polyhydroxybutyrate depolymerase